MSHVIMIEEPNGNQRLSSSSVIPIASSNSNDDLSQSLSASEYTDADESMSAPTEYLAEFLSAVMQKDYRKALKYCKFILDFEPNNVTAREFYPLIEERMRSMEERSSSDEENENYGNVMFMLEDDEVQNVAVPNNCFSHHRLVESVDDLVNVSHNSDSSGEESDEYYNDFEEKYSIGSNKSISSNAESENTTHSYSNSLLEDEEDNNGDVSDSDLEADDQYEDAHLLSPIAKMEKMPDLSDLNNGNYHQPTSCSDSESPTEPLTQKVVPIQ